MIIHGDGEAFREFEMEEPLVSDLTQAATDANNEAATEPNTEAATESNTEAAAEAGGKVDAEYMAWVESLLGNASCSDNDVYCEDWGKVGYCGHSSYAGYMQMNCRRTCKLCRLDHGRNEAGHEESEELSVIDKPQIGSIQRIAGRSTNEEISYFGYYVSVVRVTTEEKYVVRLVEDAEEDALDDEEGAKELVVDAKDLIGDTGRGGRTPIPVHKEADEGVRNAASEGVHGAVHEWVHGAVHEGAHGAVHEWVHNAASEGVHGAVHEWAHGAVHEGAHGATHEGGGMRPARAVGSLDEA